MLTLNRLAILAGFTIAACAVADPKVHVASVERNGQACNPLSMGECALPIPSSFWEKADTGTETGIRLNLPDRLLPAKNISSGTPIPLDPAPYNVLDGWSPGGSIFIHFDDELDAANLPPHEDIGKSLEKSSPVVLVDAETGERVAHWDELDVNDGKTPSSGEKAYKNHGLLIRPAAALKRSHRYIVALTIGLKATGGKKLASPRAFQALRDDEITDNAAIERLRPGYASLFAALKKAGLAKGDLLLAWDFNTASDTAIHRDILAMRTQAIKALGENGIGYKITKFELDDPDYVKVHGTYASPLFLENGGSPYDAMGCSPKKQGDCLPAGYVRGSDGLPKQKGTWDRPFVMVIPVTAPASGPAKLIQFGHGLLGGGDEIFGGYCRRFAKDHKLAFIAHDWTGLSENDVDIVSAGLLDFNMIPIVGYRLGQGIIDAISLSYTARRIQSDPEIKAKLNITHNAFTAEDMKYYGISLGGIMGGGFMALHPFIEHGVLNVAGSTWSLMLQRSSNWETYGKILLSGYPSFLDQQILITISQSLFDISDPISYAPHLITDPLPGIKAKKILYQEAVADSQVPNVASERMALSAGLPLITPSVRTPYGLKEAASAESAFSIWTDNPTPVPARTNTPPSDNDIHGRIRDYPELKEQIMRFLYGDHLIVNTCGGPCEFVSAP